jgi:hypothetical protein
MLHLVNTKDQKLLEFKKKNGLWCVKNIYTKEVVFVAGNESCLHKQKELNFWKKINEQYEVFPYEFSPNVEEVIKKNNKKKFIPIVLQKSKEIIVPRDQSIINPVIIPKLTSVSSRVKEYLKLIKEKTTV